MAETLQKVKSGDPLRISADTFNTLIDAAKAYQDGRHSQASGPRTDSQAATIVLVKNDSGADVDRFGVLGLEEALIKPAENLSEFQNRPALLGKAPGEYKHCGRLAIALAPIKVGKLGPAMTAGVIPVKLWVVYAPHEYATVADGLTTHLRTAQTGPATILWKEPGVTTDTASLKWALVQIGPQPPAMVRWAVAGGPIHIEVGDPLTAFPGNPCDPDGQNVQTNVTVQIHPVYPPSQDSQIDIDLPAGAVIPYLPFGTNEGLALPLNMNYWASIIQHPLLDKPLFDPGSPNCHSDVGQFDPVPDAMIVADDTWKWNGLAPPAGPPLPDHAMYLSYNPANAEGGRIVWADGVVAWPIQNPTAVDPDGGASVGIAPRVAREDHKHPHGPPGGATGGSLADNLVVGVTGSGKTVTVTTKSVSLSKDSKGHVVTLSVGGQSQYSFNLSIPDPGNTVTTIYPDSAGTAGVSSYYSRVDHQHPHGAPGTLADHKVAALGSVSIVNGKLRVTPTDLNVRYDGKGHVGAFNKADGAAVDYDLPASTPCVPVADGRAEILVSSVAPGAVNGWGISQAHGEYEVPIAKLDTQSGLLYMDWISLKHPLLDGDLHSDTEANEPFLGDLIVAKPAGAGFKWGKIGKGGTYQVLSVLADGSVGWDYVRAH